MKESYLKIFNLEQSNFLSANGAEEYRCGMNFPHGKQKKEYNGIEKIYTYVAFIKNEKLDIAMELWKNRGTKND